MNAPNLAVALETIARIDRDLGLAVDHVDTLAAHTCAAHRTLADLRHSLDRSVEGARELREELLAVPGDTSVQYQAVALRERTAALVFRLTELAFAEHEAAEDAAMLYGGKFQRLHDVNTFVLDWVGWIGEACFRARLAAEPWCEGDEQEAVARRTAYRNVLTSGSEGLVSIGHDDDLRHFLQAGASVQSPRFRAACRGIATLLRVQLEPAQPEAS